jgi:serine/threonine-protein kinase
MAPEQLSGDGQVDARADVLALGCILFEMVSGTPPFGGENLAEVVAHILHGTPRRLREVVPEIPHPFEEAVDACLARAPEERQTDLAALAKSLVPSAKRSSTADVFGSRE